MLERKIKKRELRNVTEGKKKKKRTL